MRLWEQKSVIGLTKRNAPNGASKFCTIIRTQIDIFVFPIYTLTLRYFSNTFHHDSAPARPRSREIRALLLNVRRRPIARWKAYLNSYALSTKRAIWLGEPDDWFLLSEPHIWRAEIQKEDFGTMLWPIGIWRVYWNIRTKNNRAKYPINCFSLSVLISIYHSIALFLQHRRKILLLDFRPSNKYNHLSTIEISAVRPSMRGIPYL